MGAACSSDGGAAREPQPVHHSAPASPQQAPAPVLASPTPALSSPLAGAISSVSGLSSPPSASGIFESLRGIEDADAVPDVVSRLVSAVAAHLQPEAAVCFLLDPLCNYVGVRIFGPSSAQTAFGGLRIPPGIGIGRRLATALAPISVDDMRACVGLISPRRGNSRTERVPETTRAPPPPPPPHSPSAGWRRRSVQRRQRAVLWLQALCPGRRRDPLTRP